MEKSPRAARRSHSFVLNLWQEGGALPNAPPVWRFSLTVPHSGERIGFRSVEELTRYLQRWTHQQPASSTHTSEGDNYVEP
ncbi:MAG: hypothetical protein KF893_09530 [Caldilineaceae bacterium]|nr:hypothetical protein [Caldilineaceae bacterium]